MSVINQVLNQLEQRGARGAPEQALVRAVPYSKRNYTLPLLLSGFVLVAGMAAWQWYQQHETVLGAVEGPKVTVTSVALKGNAIQRDDGTERSTVRKQTATAQVVSNSQGKQSAASRAKPQSMLSPPLQLSFELSAVPLPSTLRQDSRRATSTGSGQASRSENEVAPTKAVKPAARMTAPPARSRPKQTASPKANIAAVESDGESPLKQVSPAQKADAEFRKAVALMQQGHTPEAQAGYETALRLDPGHDSARQALVALLVEEKRGADAERVLQERLADKPEHTGFAMLLARLQVERGGVDEAVATLEQSLPYASAQADYQAFLAALLQRQSRNEEAIKHYQVALQLAPNNGVWLMGYGISLQSMQRDDDAREAYKKALDTQSLSPELRDFVQKKLKEL